MNTENRSEGNAVGILADQQVTGRVNKCVHVKGTEFIYVWTNDLGVKKVNKNENFLEKQMQFFLLAQYSRFILIIFHSFAIR